MLPLQCGCSVCVTSAPRILDLLYNIPFCTLISCLKEPIFPTYIFKDLTSELRATPWLDCFSSTWSLTWDGCDLQRQGAIPQSFQLLLSACDHEENAPCLTLTGPYFLCGSVGYKVIPPTQEFHVSWWSLFQQPTVSISYGGCDGMKKGKDGRKS